MKVTVLKTVSNEFPIRPLRIKNFFDDRFATIASKLEKVGPNFSILNPCSSLPSVAKEDK